MSKFKTNRAFTLLEVVVATTIISVSLLSLMSVATVSFAITEEATKKIQASFLLEEGVEVLKTLRDSGWTANIDLLTESVPYYYEFSDGDWRATSTNTYIDDFFERDFVLEDVYRDSNDDTTTIGGTLDPDIKKVTVSVSWSSRKGTTTEAVVTYITNMFNN